MRQSALLLAALLVAACGGAPEPETEDASVFDPLAESIERAKGVEETLRQNAEELRRRVEEEED